MTVKNSLNRAPKRDKHITSEMTDSRFKTMIESRLRKRLRRELSKTKRPVLFVLDSLTEKILPKLLKRPFDLKRLPVLQNSQKWSSNLVETLSKEKFSSEELILLPWTADDSAEYFLSGMSNGISKRPLKRNLILLWSDVTDAEAIRYSKLSGTPWVSSEKRASLAYWADILDDNLLHGMQKSISSLDFFGLTAPDTQQ